MTTSTHPSLGHHAYTVSATDAAPAAGPFPGMSGRATLIARSLGVAVLLGWLAVSEPRMLVVLAFALPFWIAAELESRSKPAPSVVPALAGYTGLALAPSPRDSGTGGPSTHRPSKAA